MADWWTEYKKKNKLDEEENQQKASSSTTSKTPSAKAQAAAKSSTWWEDYKRANDIYGKSRAASEQVAYRQQMRKKAQESAKQYKAIQEQLAENQKKDTVQDIGLNLFDGLWSDAHSSGRSLTRAADRYERDLPLYQQALEASVYSPGLYDKTYSQVSDAQKKVTDEYARYNDAVAKAEADRKKANSDRLSELKDSNIAAYYGETLDRHAIEAELESLRKKRETVRQMENNPQMWSSDMGGPATEKIQNTAKRGQELDAQIARYEAALKYRDAQDRSDRIRQIGESVVNSENYDEMVKVGKAMVEDRNKKAMESIDEENYNVDDPDDNNQFRNAEKRRQEDLEAAGYITDINDYYIPENVKPIYYALFARDPATAKEWAEYWKEMGESAYWNDIYEESGKNTGSRARAFIEGTFARTAAGLSPFSEEGQYAAKLGSTMIGGGAAGLTEKGLFNTGALSGEIDIPILGKKTLGDAYQLGSSMLQSEANAALAYASGPLAPYVGAAGTILLGSSAAASDYQEKIEQGWDENSAKVHAIAAGTAEAAFEYFSLDKLVNQDLTRGFIKNFLVQGGIEASEEAATTIANRISDSLISEINGYDNNIERRQKELMAKGYEYGTAEKMAQQEWLTELLNDAFGGFLSGGVMTAGHYAASAIKGDFKQAEAAGRSAMQNTESLESLRQYATDNDLGWYGAEAPNIEQVQEGQTEQPAKKGSKIEARQTAADVQRIENHIQEQFEGKTVQEQQAIRDQLQEKYGNGILPSVYQAITIDTAKQAVKLGSSDAIREARNQATETIQDADIRRAVTNGYDQAVYDLASKSKDTNELGRYIQQLRNTAAGEMSMQATVKAEDGSEKQVAITGMSEDGKSVVLSDGVKIAVKDLQADADTMDAVQQLADLDLGKDADAVFQAYKKSGVPGTEGYRWLMDYAQAYNQGRTNMISLEDAVKRSSLDQRTVMEAYTLGQKEAYQATQEGLAKLAKMPKKIGVTGRKATIDVSRIEGKTMNESERQHFDLANKAFSSIGVDVGWFASDEKDGKFVGKNGAYENGKVWLDIHAGRNYTADVESGILATTAHELTHFLQQYAPEQYQALKEFVLQQIVKNGRNGDMTLERLIWEKQKRAENKLSRKAAEDEVVADACQTMLRDSKAIAEFARENEPAAKGMVRWLDKWFTKIRNAFSKSARLSEEAQLMDSLEKSVKKAFGDLWDQSLREAVSMHDEVGNIEKTASEGGEQFSKRDEVLALEDVDWMGDNTSIKDQLQKHREELRSMNVIAEIEYNGEIEDALVDRIMEEVPNIGGGLIRNQGVTFFFDRKGAESIVNHAHTPEVSAAAISAPFVAKWGKRIAGHKNHEGHQKTTLTYAAPVILNGERANVGVVIQFTRDGRPDAVNVATDSNKAFKLKEEAASGFRRRTAKSMATVLRTKATSDDRIAQTKESVKPHGKNSDRDYMKAVENGDMETAQRMVDEAAKEAGYKIRGWHGTTNFFTVFDKSKANPEGDSGAGFYFTTNEDDVAENYANNEGADLTNKIERLADMLVYSDEYEGYDRDQLVEIAKKRLSEGNPRTISAALHVDNPVVLGDGHGLDSTFLDYEEVYNEEADEFGDPEGSLVYFVEALKEIASEYVYRQSDIDTLDEILYEYGMDGGGLSAEDAVKMAKDRLVEIEITNEDGDLIGNEIVRQALEQIGFDAIIDNTVYHKFRRMPGMSPGTTHIIVFNPSQIKVTDPVTYDDAGNVIPLSERFNKNNEDIRFSMRDPVETTDRLVAWHNMNEDALRSALELGGLAMPSWAIKTADRAHTSYGNISVIAPRDLVDPKRNRNSMIFGGDAWTPVFPGVDYHVTYESAEKLEKEIKRLVGEEKYRQIGGAALDHDNISSALNRTGGKLPNQYRESLLMKYAYLKSIGKDVSLPQTGERLDAFGHFSNEEVEQFVNRLVSGKLSLDRFRKMSTDELMQQEDLKTAMVQIRENYYRENLRNNEAFEKLKSHGFFSNAFTFSEVDAMLRAAELYFRNNGIRQTIDEQAAQEAIDKEINKADFEKWALDMLNSAVVKKGIRNDKDTFTPSGNRRSFDQLHYAYNLANIVKAMKSQPKQGRAQFLSGPGSVKGAALKSYNTVEQVRADRGRLVDSAEEGQAAYDAYNKALADILDRMGKDRFETAVALIEVIQHAKTEAGIYNYMQRELKDWYNVSKELAHDIYELIGQINELPMEYFEGKTYDAVGFDEAAAVVVPDTMDAKLKQQLSDAGATVIEYKAGDDADRLAKVNSIDDALFSLRDTEDISDADLVAGITEDKATTPEAKALLREAKAAKEKITELEKKLADAERNLTTTKRAMNTKGIGDVTRGIIQAFGISDAKNKKIAQRATEILTKAYQQALDQIDNGADAATAWQTVYEGAVKAAELLIDEGRYTEKVSRSWINTPFSLYIGEDRQQVIDQMVAAAGADFAMNRYRDAIPETAADRLVAKTEKRMMAKVEEAKAKTAAVTEENKRLKADNEFMKEQAEASKKVAGNLYDQVRELRQELKDNKKLSAEERRKLEDKIKRRNQTIEAKKAEAAAWKEAANRSAKEASAAVREKEKIVRQLEKQIEREQNILAGRLKPPAMQKLLKKEREAYEQKIKDHKDEVFRKYKERKKITDLRNRIRNLTSDIKKTAANPTARSFLPAHLADAMVDLLDVLEQAQIDTPKAGTKAAAKYYSATDAIRALADSYKQIKDDSDYTYSSEFDEDVYQGIVQLANQFVRKTKDGHMYNITANEMTLEELQQVYDTVRDIREGFRNAAKIIGMDAAMSTYDYAGRVLRHQMDVRAAKEGKKGKRIRSALDNIQLDALNPIRAAHMIDGFEDGAFYQLWKQIESGQSVKNMVIMQSIKRLQSFKTGKNERTYLQALRKKGDYGVKDVNGKTVLMTKMQAIQMLMTWQREEANKNLVHMQEGGVIIRDADLISRGKYSDAKKTQQKVKVTPEMIQGISDTMTDWDKGYMKAAREVFTSLLEQSNKVLYTLKRKVHKGEAMYIPEKVADGYLAQEVVKGGEFNLGIKEASATKDLKQKSTLPIIIDGLETMMNRHINDMANYIGLAIPIRNFAKVYNTRTSGIGVDATTVNEEITNTWGDKAGDMMMETLRQVQNGRSYEYQTVMSGLEQKIQSAFVKASLVGKISVFVKQAASYSAAGSVLSQKALDRSQQYIWALVTAPNSKLAKKIYSRIDAITPEYFMRRMGMSMEEIAMDKLSNGPVKGKLQMAGAWLEGKGPAGKAVRHAGAMINPTNWIQRMDVATTGALVIACERQAKYDGFKQGTAEYEAHVRELYERVIRETQPMYDPLHRPALQKNAGALTRMLFPFRTVPFQNYGQIMDAYGTMQAAMQNGSKEEKKAAAKHFGKTLWANFESALVFAALGMLSYAIMHKPKRYLNDDDELTLESVLKAYGFDVLDVMIGNLMPYGGTEMKDLVERWINGDKWYDIMSVGPADLVNETAKSILKLKDASDRYSAGEINGMALKNQILGTTMQVTKLFGLPISNMRDVYTGVSADVNDLLAGRLSIDRSNAVNAKRYYKAWMSGDSAKAQDVMKELQTNTGNDEEKIRNAVNKVFKTAYETGEISLAEYTRFIFESGLFDEERQKTRIRDLARDAIADGEMGAAEAERYLTESGFYDADEAWKKVREWQAKEDVPEDDEDYSYSEYDALREALRSGESLDEASADYLAHGYTEKQVQSAATTDLKARFLAGDISEDKAIDLLMEYSGKDENAAWKTVQEWQAKAEHADDEDYSYSQYDAIDAAIDANQDIKSLVKDLTDHGVEEKNITNHVKSYLIDRYVEGSVSETALKNQLSRYCGIIGETADKLVRNANVEKATGYSWDELDNAYMDGNVSETAAKQALTKFGGMSAEEASARIRYWNFRKAYPDSTIQQETVDKYYDKVVSGTGTTLQRSGLSLDNYVKYYTQASKAKGADKNNDGRTDSGSVKAEKMQIINSLPISNSQKDALYYFEGWSSKTIYEAPWH